MNDIFEDDSNLLVYDGECPVCSRYATFVKFQKAVGPVSLINARERADIVEAMAERNMDIDEGMLLKLGNDVYYGDECLEAIALYSDESRWLQRQHNRLFIKKGAAKNIYPKLRAGRNALLKLMGIKKIRGNSIEK
ncbi:MAG TPA: DCC1-like thiol-disulfide oxidoreductase family protein [Marinagarivorans sp.]